MYMKKLRASDWLKTSIHSYVTRPQRYNAGA